MEIKLDIRTEGNLEIREQLTPDGMIDIITYHPSPSTTPWDYYGMCHLREYSRVLQAAGIECLDLRTVHKIIRPVGSGRNGAVRFGDNMCPGIFRLAIKPEDKSKAEQAIAEHKAAVDQWLMHNGPQPAACRG